MVLGAIVPLVAASSLVGELARVGPNSPDARLAGRHSPIPSKTFVGEEVPPLITTEAQVAARWRSRLASNERTQRHGKAPYLLAEIPHALPITARPGGGGVVGTMPAGSRVFGVPLVAWILDRSTDGRRGKVTVPYSGTQETGWIRLAGLKLRRTPYAVHADLSRRLVFVKRRNEVVMRFPAATGSPASPTPPGRYFVTDRVPFSPGGPLGSFGFGISGIQTRLPAGWSGADQLAIHGTNDPGSIGSAASAGCLRVSARALERLKPVLNLGTPVTIRP